jgi:hypothetical protein
MFISGPSSPIMRHPLDESKYSEDGREATDIWMVFTSTPAGLNSRIAPELF